MKLPIPSVGVLKQKARALRLRAEQQRRPVSHGQALEVLAEQYGFADWNTLKAMADRGMARAPFSIGQRVRGAYLGHSFDGEVISLEAYRDPNLFRIGLRMDQPVDVAVSSGFTAMRQNISSSIDGSGRSAACLSDGTAHLVVEAATS